MKKSENERRSLVKYKVIKIKMFSTAALLQAMQRVVMWEFFSEIDFENFPWKLEALQFPAVFFQLHMKNVSISSVINTVWVGGFVVESFNATNSALILF